MHLCNFPEKKSFMPKIATAYVSLSAEYEEKYPLTLTLGL